jgi:elongation factor P
MKILGNEIKPRMILDYDNDQWEVIKSQHVKPGKGGAFNQVELKSVNKNTKRNKRFRSSDNVERVVLEEKKFNFLFEGDNDCHFMDQVTFEQIAISKKKIGEKIKLLKENLEVTINFFEDNPLSIELPISIECKVISTDVALKGQTVSSSYKPAIINSNLKILVPPFIESGDKITIDSRSLEYIKKV